MSVTRDDGPLTATRYALLLALVIALSLLARYVHFPLTVGSDDQKWIIVARTIAEGGEHTLQPAYYSRLLWTWLLIAWGALGSLTLEWSAVLMFLLSALTTLVVAESGRAAFGARAGLLAGSIYAFHPLALVYDTVTLPDVLAVLLLAIGMLLFIRYIRRPSLIDLACVGVITGAFFQVKSYFVLFGLPCAMTILILPTPFSQRVRHLVILAAAGAAGLLLSVLVSYLSGVDPLATSINSTDEYAEYIRTRSSEIGGYQGWKNIIFLSVHRIINMSNIIFDYGLFLGVVILFGLVFCLFHWYRAPVYPFILLTVLTFTLFLCFMPVSISPFSFVEWQDRYLTVVLPGLAVASGTALSQAWGELSDRSLRASAAVVLLFVLGFSATVPNELHDRYRLLEFRGLQQELKTSSSTGLQSLALPVRYWSLLPDSFFALGPRIEFREYFTEEGALATIDAIEGDAGRAVFVSRRNVRRLKTLLHTGDYTDDAEVSQGASLMRLARERGLIVREVRVPYDTFRLWLRRLGVETRGQLVGWVVSKA